MVLSVVLKAPEVVLFRIETTKKRGAGERVRTDDVQLGRLTLYQLSYTRGRNVRPGFRPAHIAPDACASDSGG